jgi:signal transduction histidine kinase
MPSEVSAAQAGEFLSASVTIPEHDIANLFEPFFRVDRSRSNCREQFPGVERRSF